jgi:hypothetical protein
VSRRGITAGRRLGVIVLAVGGLALSAPAGLAAGRTSAALPGHGAIDGVACPSVSECVAVDTGGDAVTFNPQAPDGATLLPGVPPGALHGVTCPSATQCSAVGPGQGGNGEAITFDPTAPGTPTVLTLPGDAANAIACPATTQCTAVGSLDAETTFNPAGPAPAAASLRTGAHTARFLSVACPLTTQCTAIGVGTENLTFNPLSPPAPTVARRLGSGAGQTASLACPSATQCVAIEGSNETGVLRLRPSHPLVGSLISDELPANTILAAIACASASQCTAVGVTHVYSSAHGGRFHNNDPQVTFNPQHPGRGTTAKVVHNDPTGHGLLALACPSVSQCTGVYGHQEVTFDPGLTGS